MESQYKPHSLKVYLGDPVLVNIRDLMYAVLDTRDDIPTSPIMNDYLRNGTWNIVCTRDEINPVMTFIQWFLQTIVTEIGIESLEAISHMTQTNNLELLRSNSTMKPLRAAWKPAMDAGWIRL